MSTNKLVAFSFTAVLLAVLLQFSNAQNKTTTEFDHIVNIVDPAEVAGTVVLLKDLI